MEPTATPIPTPIPSPIPEIIPEPSMLPDLSVVSTQLQTLIDNQIYSHSLLITFGNLFMGLLIGYFAARGLTDPWK
ncbi:hypothetical protein ACFWMP_31405 [Paenibacillus sp. NPDC058367]|uniref:hypothetical protein n=1 Tax=Paenibacillus sp. NPDC058367 TaxID=3346460 RepID=UPI00364F8F92